MFEPTFVYSPAGIRLVIGLAAPFLAPGAQREVEERWGAPADVLFKESADLAEAVRSHPALHAALAVWTRDAAVPEEAALRLGRLLQSLPHEVSAAQHVLDRWAAENTHDMIEKFPGEVREQTRLVLASAVAVEDTWSNSATDQHLPFNGRRVQGFRVDADPAHVTVTPDGRSLLVELPLKSGLLMRFCLSRRGVDTALTLIENPEQFTASPAADSPFIEQIRTMVPRDAVAVSLPEFEIRTLLDLAAEPAAWGLDAAFSATDAAPGLGENLELGSAAQASYVEVTREGVRAAAVTAIMIERAAVPVMNHIQRAVTFRDPFAYTLTLPGHPTPLFAGTYSG